MCKEVIMDLLLDYLEQTLSPGLAANLEAHLATCPPCRAYLQTYKKTGDLVARAMIPPMPEEMKERLREFLLKKLAQERS